MTYFTDIHGRTEWETPQAMLLTAKLIQEEQTDVVLCGGDLITDGFEAPIGGVDERWAVARTMFDAIHRPVHMAIGNHDLVAADPKDGSPAAANPRDEFLAFTGLSRSYRSLDIRGHHIIFLDPFHITDDALKYIGVIDPPQLAWLQADLENVAPTTPIVLACHMPLLTAYYQMTKGSTAPAPRNRVVTNNTDVLKLFENHRLRLVLQGHLHVQETLRWKETTFITGGAVCGKWWRGSWKGTPAGFGRIHVTPHAVEWTYRPTHWQAKRPQNA